ncbi:DUF4238 domain-containing protein [Vibrio metschnikovii]|uniref:DUF4238 domain-containing protein n=1 Tax=Vibrio metschnikovii TaxID=28172 RepID=UPI001C2F3476|nr:DUF4238 domain-containing protein [Vibrio metschnikovii]
MKKTNKNHFSPVLANRHWTSETEGWSYKRYYYCNSRKCVVESKRDVGKNAWGYEINLYSQDLEDRLASELENESARIYEKLIHGVTLSKKERMKWGQYIVTQAVRTPSFFRYRDYLDKISGGDFSYKKSIIGCENCIENQYIANRNWYLLKAHKDDYFVRTDNPIYMTGFIQNPTTTVFYPLSPQLCFVACSFVEGQFLLKGQKPIPPKQEFLQLEKGDAHFINFELIKSASSSMIVAKRNHNIVVDRMAIDMLGQFPQIPFMLSSAFNDYEEYMESEQILNLMSIVDKVNYPEYRKYPLKPFYGVEFDMGINPFSIFGLTDGELKKQGLID